LAQINSIDNLIAEFEKVAPTIDQLLEMAAKAAELKAKLTTALNEATTTQANIDATQQRLNQGMADVVSLKQSLESRISASQTLDKNVGDKLRQLKSEVLTEISNLNTKKTELDAAKQAFSTATAQLLADKSSLLDQAISDLSNKEGQELNDLKASLETALRNFSTQSTPLLADIPGRLQQLDTDKQAAISAFQTSVDKAIATLPSQFNQLKGQLTQAIQTHVGNELQQFLSRQNTLVSNLNQRIDALENLNRTQQESMLANLNRLTEVLEKRGSGFLGLFR
jgi:hypothetical protein